VNGSAKPVIREISIRGFRSIADLSIKFSNPTFLVGRNGAGKSNITDAISFLADAMNSPLSWAIERRGGMQALCTKRSDNKLGTIAFLIRFGTLPPETMLRMPPDMDNSSRYSFELKPTEDGGYEIVREQAILDAPGGRKWFDFSLGRVRSNTDPEFGGRMKWLATGALVMPTTGGLNTLGNIYGILRSMCVYGIEPSALRMLQDPDAFPLLRSDGSNAASIWESLAVRRPDAVQQILHLLAAVTPGVADIRTVKYSNKKALEFTLAWEGARIVFDAHSMSSGTLRALGLLLAVFQERTPTLLAIEEPENSMHPGATSVLLDVLKFACSETQVLVTTQSPEVLDANWIQDENLRVVAWENGHTTVNEVPQASKVALQTHLMTAGELFRSEALVPSGVDTSRRSHAEFFVEL
jgi:predicted ATPase